MMRRIFIVGFTTALILLSVALILFVTTAMLAIWTDTHFYDKLGYTGLVLLVLGVFLMMGVLYPGENTPMGAWQNHKNKENT
jgi:hypothetical protein